MGEARELIRCADCRLLLGEYVERDGQRVLLCRIASGRGHRVFLGPTAIRCERCGTVWQAATGRSAAMLMT